MGVHPESLKAPFGMARRGIALPMALLVLVGMAAIPAALFSIAWAQGRAERGRADAALAMEIAEAGAAHAVGIISSNGFTGVTFTAMLRGRDNVGGTADDGLLRDYPSNLLNKNDEITAQHPFPSRGTRLGTYSVQVVNDPEEVAAGSAFTDLNNKVMVRCVSLTDRGDASATVNLVWSRISPLNLNVATGGDLQILGANNSYTGGCKGVYVGGELDAPSSSPSDDLGLTWYLVGGAKQGNYRGSNVVGSASLLSLPQLTTDKCPEGALGGSGGPIPSSLLRNGGKDMVAQVSQLTSGRFYCVTGNVTITGSGSRTVTIFAGGHIEVDGTADLTHNYPRGSSDNTVLRAGGDVKVTGAVKVTGSIYCRSQFYVAGLDMNQGQLVCRDDLDPPPSIVCPTGTTCQYSLVDTYGMGYGGVRRGLSTISSGSGTGKSADPKNAFNFASCNGKYQRIGFELSRVAWYPTFGN